MIAGLLELGRRLGYQAKALDGFDAAWLDGTVSGEIGSGRRSSCAGRRR